MLARLLPRLVNTLPAQSPVPFAFKGPTLIRAIRDPLSELSCHRIHDKYRSTCAQLFVPGIPQSTIGNYGILCIALGMPYSLVTHIFDRDRYTLKGYDFKTATHSTLASQEAQRQLAVLAKSISERGGDITVYPTFGYLPPSTINEVVLRYYTLSMMEAFFLSLRTPFSEIKERLQDTAHLGALAQSERVQTLNIVTSLLNAHHMNVERATLIKTETQLPIMRYAAGKMPEALKMDEAWLSVLLQAADQLIAQPDFISLLHDPADGYHVEAKQIVSALAALETCGVDTPEKRAAGYGAFAHTLYQAIKWAQGKAANTPSTARPY